MRLLAAQRRPFLRYLAGTSLLFAASAHAQTLGWSVGGDLPRSCVVEFSCGGNDRCNQLRLDDRVNAQETALITVTCNFARGGAALEFQSQNNGALRAARDALPLGYDVSMSGTSGNDFAGRRLGVPLRVAFRAPAPGTPVTGMLRMRLDDRQESLAADRYSDRITITIEPEQ